MWKYYNETHYFAYILKIETQNKEERKLRKYRDLRYYPLERTEWLKRLKKSQTFDDFIDMDLCGYVGLSQTHCAILPSSL